MSTFVYDFKNQHTFLPNLIKDQTLVPNTKAWWDLCLNPPFSYELRLIKYLQLDSVPFEQCLVSEMPDDVVGLYCVNINFFDPEIDYFELMEPESLKLLQEGKITFVFYYSEGDDIDVEIDPVLNHLCLKHKINLQDIRFVIANGLAEAYGHPYIFFPDDELYYRYLHYREKDFVTEVNIMPRTKKFTCLTRIDKPFRRLFGASIWQHGLHNEGYFSYNDEQYKTSAQEHECDHVFDWKEYWSDIPMLLVQFDLHTPIQCDELDDASHNNHKLINHDHYQDSYWNFILETHFNNSTIFLTEKTFKPILNMQPFIIIGNPHSLKLLRELGYKTFDNYICEDYDDNDDDEARMHDVFSECFKLVSYPNDAHRKVTVDMVDILEHNQKVFLRSKADRLNILLERLA